MAEDNLDRRQILLGQYLRFMILSTLKRGTQLPQIMPQIERPNRVDPREYLRSEKTPMHFSLTLVLI